MRIPKSKLGLTLFTTVAAFVAAIVLCQVFEWLGFPEQDQVKSIKDMAGWSLQFALMVVWILLAAPVIEESLFRGLLFRLPSRFVTTAEPPRFFAFHARFFIAAASSAVFSFAHYIDFAALCGGRGFALLPPSNAFPALFVVGIAWCWLYRRTGSLWCGMLSHSLFNAINLLLALAV